MLIQISIIKHDRVCKQNYMPEPFLTQRIHFSYTLLFSPVIRVLLVLPAMTEFPDSLAFLDLQAPLDPLALAE